jgi:hypothetical protein
MSLVICHPLPPPPFHPNTKLQVRAANNKYLRQSTQSSNRFNIRNFSQLMLLSQNTVNNRLFSYTDTKALVSFHLE